MLYYAAGPLVNESAVKRSWHRRCPEIFTGYHSVLPGYFAPAFVARLFFEVSRGFNPIDVSQKIYDISGRMDLGLSVR